MLIDVSTYVGHWPFKNLRHNTLDGLDKLARGCGITHMAVASFNAIFYKDSNAGNMELLDELASYRGETSFLPFAVVNPVYTAWEKDARRAVELGFAGFELCPVYHGYSLAPSLQPGDYFPTQPAAAVLELAAELDVPVRIAAGFENFRGRSHLDKYDNVTGDELYALIKTNARASVIITNFPAHAAGENLKALIKERGNIFFDIEAIDGFVTASAGPAGKVVPEECFCFGSLSPMQYIETNLIKLRYVPELSYPGIRAENIRRVFKSLR